MMKQSTKKQILRISCSAILCLTLLFALMETGNTALLDEAKQTYYFGFALLSLAVYELLSFFYQRHTEPQKLDFIRLGYVAVDLLAAGFAFFVPLTTRLFVLSTVLYYLVPIAKRVLALIQKSKMRRRVYNVMTLILTIILMLISIALLGASRESYALVELFPCLLIMLSSLINICSMAFSQFNKEILLNIVRKTYAGEILVGLMLLVIAFSLVLTYHEDNVKTFGDALWYCFAVITTIGFGDIAAVTLEGRILTVILGIYGIIVVAILTSIIVNFYSEVKNIKDDDDDEDAIPTEESTEEAPADEVSENEGAAPIEDTEQPTEGTDTTEVTE